MNIIEIYLYLQSFILGIAKIYSYIIIIYCCLSMALSLGVLQHPIFINLYHILARMTEPFLSPIRALMPDMGSFDLAPLILLLILDELVPFCLKQLFKIIWVSLGQF